jgi:hypothetical protein
LMGYITAKKRHSQKGMTFTYPDSEIADVSLPS